MSKMQWTPGMDLIVRTLREQGNAWETIGKALDIGVNTVIRRGRALGLDTETRLNSGPMSGVDINAGVRPMDWRFRRPWYRARLGQKWIGKETCDNG